MKKAAALLALALAGAGGSGGEMRGMKHPALSPDGQRLAFSWHGDLWICPAEGGRALRLTDDPADEQKPAWSPDGRRIAYSSDRWGNRDLFVIDAETRAVRQLTVHSSDDDAPAWSPDGHWIAFQSSRDSNLDLALNDSVFDVWKIPAGGGTATRVTRFRGENPAWSPDGRWIAYDRYSSGYSDGEHNLLVIAPDGSGVPRELATGSEDSRRPAWKGETIYFAHEANGIQLSAQRNLWRTTVQGGPLFQVTGHRTDHVTWPATSRDGNVLVYEHDFDLYALDLAKPSPRKLAITAEHRYDDPATTLPLTGGFQSPAWSPSGAEIVFAARGDLWISSVEGGDARPLTRGVPDDRDPSWSRDGKEIVYVSTPLGMPGHVVRIAASGGEPRPVTRDEGHYRSPRLSPRGDVLAVCRAEGSEIDLLLVDVRTGEARPFAAEKGADESAAAFSPDGTRVAYLAGLLGRTDVRVRALDEGSARTLRTEPSAKFGLDWSPDGSRLAYSVRSRGGPPSVRVLPVEGGRETSAAPGAQRPSWSPDSTMLLCEEPQAAGGAGAVRLAIHDAKGGQRLGLAVRAVRSTPRSEEMTSVFQQVWSSYFNNYYDPFFHGVDMKALRDKYAPLAAGCRTKPELYDLLNEMIRELRSSHIHLKPAPVKNAVATGSLAADLAPGPDGALVVARVEPGGPASKAGLREGEEILSAPSTDLDRLMTGPSAPPEVRLRVRGADGATREVAVKGLDRTALRQLKYGNWIARNKKTTRERSSGRLAYFHIRMMTQPEVTRLRDALEGECAGAEGLVFDERDGMGGLAHRPVCALLDSTAQERLNQVPACWTRNRNGSAAADRYGGGRAARKSWDKPVIMIQNEISRSDKEILPHTFRHLGIGYLVGMPTAGGVIGGSEWTMQDGSRIVVSVQGWFTAEGRNMEGWGVPPDYRVPVTHEDLIAGRDPQLEKAVDVLLAQMDGRIAPPRKPGLEKSEGNPGK